jgi:hypothetical protein
MLLLDAAIATGSFIVVARRKGSGRGVNLHMYIFGIEIFFEGHK